MPKTFTAPFAQDPRPGCSAVVTAAVTGLSTDAPANTVLLLTADTTDGSVLTRLRAMPRGSVTASSLLLFISGDGGNTKRLLDSELMPAQTISTTTAINEVHFLNYSESTPLRMGPGEQLYVGSQVALAAGIVFTAELTDF